MSDSTNHPLPFTVNRPPSDVVIKKGEWVDETRAGRRIAFKIYHPADNLNEKMPVILWSHGYGGNRDGAGFISRFIASYGYALVHITHPGTDSSLWEGQPGHPWDILRSIKITPDLCLQRFADVPFALDQLALWAANNPETGRLFDFTRTGMAGHSLGALTTQVMAGQLFPDEDDHLLRLKDPRFQAAISYSPMPMHHFTDAPDDLIFGGVDIPMFCMTGTDDSSPIEGFGYRERLSVFDNLSKAARYLMVLPHGDHMVYNGTRGQLEKNPYRETHEKIIKIASLGFWEAYLRGNAGALGWLKENYSSNP